MTAAGRAGGPAAGGAPRPRVVFLLSFMNVAGAQVAAVRVARALRERGYDAEVWFFYREAAMDTSGVPTRVFFAGDRPGPWPRLRSFLEVLKELRGTKPQAVVSMLPLANVVGQLLALLAGVPRRIASQRSPLGTFSKAMRLGDLVAGTLGVYTRVIAVSRTVEESFARAPGRYRRRFTVVYNGLDWRPSPLTRAEARARFGIPADAFVALSVGRFKGQKNYPFQVEVARRLVRSVIVVAGDGPERAGIEARVAALGIGDRMLFLGNVAAADMPHLLAASDCFIQPSLFEGQSNALLEAMHQGIPVLVSETPSQRETVVDPERGPAGLVLPLADPGAWSDAIDGLAADPERRARYAARAKARARAFTLERQIEGFLAAIEGRP